MSILDLVREDLRDFSGYKSARTEDLRGEVWLNANESAWANPADPSGSSRRYPQPQPDALRAALAKLYGCLPTQLLMGRGSDEAIDLLVRALCQPGRDGVLITPPVFGMYAVSARLQNVPLIEMPLSDDGNQFICDVDAIARLALAKAVKLVFLCSPSNPTGGAIALADITHLARQLDGRAVVVVDEAYVEFSAIHSAVSLLDSLPNLAVLRTLSKAHALAAARIGVVMAAPELIAVLRNCQAPYPVPTPCAELALAGLDAQALQKTADRVAVIVAERERMLRALSLSAQVRKVYPSQGNYLLARFHDPRGAFDRLLAAGVVVRDQRAAPQLGDALRISIGSPEQNDRVLEILQAQEMAA